MDQTQRVGRGILAVVVVVATLAACGPANLPGCPGLERPWTGDLGVDMVGRWKQISFAGRPAHPLLGFIDGQGAGELQLEFYPDGSGEYWWYAPGGVASEKGAGTGTLTWQVDDGLLVVDDLPPAEVKGGAGGVVISYPNEPTGAGLAGGWTRCALVDG